MSFDNRIAPAGASSLCPVMIVLARVENFSEDFGKELSMWLKALAIFAILLFLV